ncbi:MAG: DUF2007 domain-containing protein [Pseudomonadota bacterium]
MKTVLHALDSIEANLIKGLLENEGISCAVLGEYLHGAIGELPANDLIRVVVNDEDYEPAVRLLESWKQAKLMA